MRSQMYAGICLLKALSGYQGLTMDPEHNPKPVQGGKDGVMKSECECKYLVPLRSLTVQQVIYFLHVLGCKRVLGVEPEQNPVERLITYLLCIYFYEGAFEP